MKSPTHEILVCPECHLRPRACRCGYKFQGVHDSSLYSLEAKRIRGRKPVMERVLTRPATHELSEILVEACRSLGPDQVAFRLSQGDPIGEAVDANDLRKLRRLLFGEPGNPRRIQPREPAHGIV
jgi:hypothetical protein